MHVVGGVGWAMGLLRDDPPEFDAAAELAGDIGVGRSSYTDYDLAITEAAEDWLHGKSGAEQPWAAFVSLVSPHYPLIAPQEFLDLYDPADMDLPIGYAPDTRPDHPELQNVARFFKYDRYFDEAKVRMAKAAYYGLTSFMDACIGRILKALNDSGQADNTVIVYVSDHGDMMGDLGFWTKQVMYDASVGVPMIAAGPGVPIGRRVTTGTSLLDLSATALDVLGIADWAIARPGMSLREIAQSEDDPDRTVFSEYHDGGSTTGTYMVRWQHWKYVYYVGYPPQLFNMAIDPNELHDLAADAVKDPAIQSAVNEGERRLRAICDPEAVNDRCLADQKQRIEQLGGRSACRSAYSFNHTPTPAEQDKLRDETAR